MSGVIETGLIAGLAQLARALEGRRAALLSELRMVEQDLEAAQRTIDVAARVGFRMPLPASPPEAATRQAAERPAEPRTPQPSVKTKTPEPPMEAPETLAAYARTIQSLKTLRPNSSLMAAPPRVAKGLRKTVADVPMDGPELDALRDSLAGLAEKVAEAPLEPGSRGRLSSKGLVPGEPMAPAIVAILRASDRPLSSVEVTSTMLQTRGLDYRGPQLTSVISRVSSLLGDLAKKRRVRRITVKGERAKRWVLTDGG
jgi:hypothetical protein